MTHITTGCNTNINTNINTNLNTNLSQERMEAIFHLAEQIDLQITELSEEMESIHLRLESLRALSAQISNLQDGSLSDEKTYALVQAGKEAGRKGHPSPAYIIDEIMIEEFVTSPE